MGLECGSLARGITEALLCSLRPANPESPPKGLLKQHQKSSKRILFQASPTGRKALALVTAKGLCAMRSTRMGHVGFHVCHICDCCCYCAGRLLPANPYRYSSSNGCTHLFAATLKKPQIEGTLYVPYILNPSSPAVA